MREQKIKIPDQLHLYIYILYKYILIYLYGKWYWSHPFQIQQKLDITLKKPLQKYLQKTQTRFELITIPNTKTELINHIWTKIQLPRLLKSRG